MYFRYNKKLIDNAQSLRKNMTPQEKHLWYDFCKSYPVKIVRQRTIFSYIVDFYCSSARLVIELDGSQHYEEENMINDIARTENLNTLGIEVLRFSNRDIDTNFEGVCMTIHDTIQRRIREKHYGQVYNCR